jgi:hypothetical protein
MSSIIDQTDPTISNCIITGDLNASIGSYQTPSNSSQIRNSKDTVINPRGRDLARSIEPSNLVIINGCSPSKHVGNYLLKQKR